MWKAAGQQPRMVPPLRVCTPPIDQLPTGTSLSMFEMGPIALFVLFSSSDAGDN